VLDVRSVTIKSEQWRLRQPFRFSGFTVETLETVHASVSDGQHSGQGEGVVPVVFNVRLEDCLAELEVARSEIAYGGDALTVCARMAPGPARNALDCALWDLRAKASGKTVWELAGLPQAPATLEVDQSIGLASPDEMASKAAASAHAVLKVKLDSTLVVERMSALRAARPDAAILVDANQGWTVEELLRFTPVLAELRVSMIEQPLRVGQDEALRQLNSPVPLYADESCHTRADLPRIAPLYDGINIKLDKTGGLTEALALARDASALGLGLMVGCMAGTSLSMAPAYVIGSLCNWADLDGPLLLEGDRPPAMNYRDGNLECFSPALWG